MEKEDIDIQKDRETGSCSLAVRDIRNELGNYGPEEAVTSAAYADHAQALGDYGFRESGVAFSRMAHDESDHAGMMADIAQVIDDV